MSVIEYVGRRISRDGTSMSPTKIKSVVDFPKPTTNTALRSFLGTCEISYKTTPQR